VSLKCNFMMLYSKCVISLALLLQKKLVWHFAVLETMQVWLENKSSVEALGTQAISHRIHLGEIRDQLVIHENDRTHILTCLGRGCSVPARSSRARRSSRAAAAAAVSVGWAGLRPCSRPGTRPHGSTSDPVHCRSPPIDMKRNRNADAGTTYSTR
jgi:hypothetical protein